MIRISLLVAAALATGCASMGGGGPTSAVAYLEPTKGNMAAGRIAFVQQGDKVVISGAVTGLKKDAEHGFHVHEKGDCSSGDGMSAGGHFNPGGKPHGHHGSAERHVGDMPNLKADAYGNATVSSESTLMSVGSGGPNDIVGKGLIVHKDPDDYKTQPTGNAGARVACAVIQLQKK
jgi:Cu-Zn family superoxide dismutase